MSEFNFEHPADYIFPDWSNCGKCHDWKNYINEGLQGVWVHQTHEVRALMAANADEIADREEWD